MTPKAERRRLIRNALTCRQAMRTYSNPVIRGTAAGYYVLIRARLKELRALHSSGASRE